MIRIDEPEIPSLNLFGAHRKNVPVRDSARFHYGDTHRYYNQRLDVLKPNMPSCSYDSTERPLMEHSNLRPPQLIPYIPPSTYLECAQNYILHGHPLHLPRQNETGRFIQNIDRIQTSKSPYKHSSSYQQTAAKMRYRDIEPKVNQRNFLKQFVQQQNVNKKLNIQMDKEQIKSDCCFFNKNKESESEGNNHYISKDIYLNKEIKYIKPTDKEMTKKEITHNVEFNVRPNNKKTDDSHHQLGPEKTPYLNLNTDRQNSNTQKNEPKKSSFNFFDTIFNKSVNIHTQKSVIKEEEKREERSVDQEKEVHENIKKKVMISEGVQATEEKEVNRSSVIMEKMMRSIPSMLDEQSFRKLLKEQNHQFHNIKLEFDEEYPIIDIDDLIQTKQEYIEHSNQLFFKLNKLAGEPLALIGQIFKTKKQQGIIWPDFSQLEHTKKTIIIRE